MADVRWTYDLRADAYPPANDDPGNPYPYEDLHEAPLTLGDLRQFVREAERWPDHTEIRYLEPITGGDPAGWGIRIETRH